MGRLSSKARAPKPAKKRKTKPDEEVLIPKEANQDKLSVEECLIFLYGPPKIGKSTWASQMEDPIFLSTEPGLKFLSVRKIVIDTWQKFQDTVVTLEKQIPSGKVKCSNIVVDTIDNLGKFCLDYVCDKFNFSHPSDEEWGKGWEAYYDEWHHWMVRLAQIGVGVVFIGHATEREVISRSLKLTKTMPAMAKTCYRSVIPMCDFILYAGFKTTKSKKTKKLIEKRVLYTKPSETLDAGDRSNELPETMPFEFSAFKEVFDSLA